MAIFPNGRNSVPLTVPGMSGSQSASGLTLMLSISGHSEIQKGPLIMPTRSEAISSGTLSAGRTANSASMIPRSYRSCSACRASFISGCTEPNTMPPCPSSIQMFG